MPIENRFSDPFFHSTYDTVVEIVGGEVILGDRLPWEKAELESLGFAIIIGLTGICQGHFIVDTNKNTALKIAEIMNMESISEFNDLVRSTFGELANMITGAATTSLQNSGFDINISPPTLFEGDRMIISAGTGLPAMTSMLTTELGELRINLALEMQG